MFLTPKETMVHGLRFFGIRTHEGKKKYYEELFRKHYGSSSLDLADVWFDMQHATINNERLLSKKETSERGLKMFFMAIHFLWAYPKNAELLASTFNCCLSYCQGDRLWSWIKKIQGLKATKIVWPDHFNSPASEVFVVSVDGVDFKTWKKKHAIYHRDKGTYSSKFNHGGSSMSWRRRSLDPRLYG